MSGTTDIKRAFEKIAPDLKLKAVRVSRLTNDEQVVEFELQDGKVYVERIAGDAHTTMLMKIAAKVARLIVGAENVTITDEEIAAMDTSAIKDDEGKLDELLASLKKTKGRVEDATKRKPVTSIDEVPLAKKASEGIARLLSEPEEPISMIERDGERYELVEDGIEPPKPALFF